MFKEYLDKPREIEKWVLTLTDKEREIFDAGYVLALCSLLEQITESKTKLANKMFDLEDVAEDEDEEEFFRAQLEARLLLLDIYEKHYTLRAKVIAGRHKEQSHEL